MKKIRKNININFYGFVVFFVMISISILPAQELVEEPRAIGFQATESFAFVDKMNVPGGVSFQDIKKAVCFLKWQSLEDNKWYTGTGFLVNTVNNTYVNEKKKVYLLTANHNDLPVGNNIGKGSPTAEQLSRIFISFDYETSDPTRQTINDISEEENYKITSLWRVRLQPLVQDPNSDIALYEIIPYQSEKAETDWSIKNSTIFQDAYAAGWSLHPGGYDNKGKLGVIGHPAEKNKTIQT